jgi:hypothetical protein
VLVDDISPLSGFCHFLLLKLTRQKQLLNDSLRRQEQYRQSIHDIGNRLDDIRRAHDDLRQAVSQPQTADELDTNVQKAEVSCQSARPLVYYIPMVCLFLCWLTSVDISKTYS